MESEWGGTMGGNGHADGGPGGGRARWEAEDYAGLGRRFLAWLVDSAAFVVLFAVLSLILDQVAARPGPPPWPELLLGLALSLVYYVVVEATWGATLGKAILGIRVVRLDGSPCDLRASLVRNALRVLDWQPAFYVLGGALVAVSTERQRLGDRLAGTLVVRRASAQEVRERAIELRRFG